MSVEVPKHIKTPSELVHWFANANNLWHPGFQEGLIRGAQEMLKLITDNYGSLTYDKLRASK